MMMKAATILAVVRLLEELPVRETGDDRLLVVVTVAATILSPYFVQWSFSGMETITALGVGLWIIRGAFAGSPTWPRLVSTAALVAVAPLLRPELLLLNAVAGPVVLWRAWRLRRCRRM